MRSKEKGLLDKRLFLKKRTHWLYSVKYTLGRQGIFRNDSLDDRIYDTRIIGYDFMEYVQISLLIKIWSCAY